MKKIFIILMLIFSVSAFAANIADIPDFELSSGVSGYFFTNNSSGNDATKFVVSTGHDQGDVAYASGNFVTAIYTKEISGDTMASSDMLNSESGLSWDSSDLSGWGTAK